MAAVALAGTGVKHLERRPVSSCSLVRGPSCGGSVATTATPSTAAVSHRSHIRFSRAISRSPFFTDNTPGRSGTFVPACTNLGLGHRG
ncbi:rCG53610 [Rattus norvegicus]|uniref:RCG53610 n=1 Tax=Rattus norvegicus TaxID=10116 RepID=A6J9N9_RAT|nr:rCG53610 [Rattus norvegicus]